MASTPTYTNPPSICHPQGYSHISTAEPPSRIVTIAGQVGQGSSGAVDASYDKQVAQAFANLGACLAAAGASPTQVTKLNYYIVNYEASKLAAVGDALKAMFGGLHRLPPSTLIPVPALASPEHLFEVDAMAAVHQDSATAANVADVIVVGAGLSGLEAARGIQAAGLSCLVVEAMDRVGGKTLSVQSVPGRVGVNDLGAAWINDTSQAEVYKLFKRYHLKGEFQRAEGKSLYQDMDGKITAAAYGEPSTSQGAKAALEKLLPGWSRLSESHRLEDPWASPGAKDLDGVSFKEYCEKELGFPASINIADQLTRALLGVEADQVSTLYMIDYIKSATGLVNITSDLKEGGQYIRCRTGTQSIAINLAQELQPGSLHLATPVTAVEQSPSGCTVRSSTGAVFRSKKVVVSVPTTLYPSITFTPPLPAGKLALAENSILGYFSKVIFVWDEPWWRHQGFSGILQSSIGPVSLTRDTSIEADQVWSITCFLAGGPGQAWSQLSKMAREKAVWTQFCATFESVGGRVPEPVNVIEFEWSKQQYFLGAPCTVYGLNDLSTVGADLRKPFHNIHFVGTETSVGWKGYMEGALRSGQRGSGEVVASLARPSGGFD
ncbi:uncharacterized protein Z520_11950 [Fonsecaea multimorphosa CBS 102226]|uniref:Amine oxidase n=1 Tax=Fonsecaea multimorphosa CBS 102226 TaxID=1442371 RepID=A0A0D2JGP0_9EURO|nr:uncharacterized protein Z520_11950 [Fonsecaea multimorphosa CBS 102226]KIX92342.1 hypothetical protein Z520_11950 [Fonsecaea multimorphosa CBS 102226]OAL17716.1 hypothetical protein AYO22_11372 [Fonsecaea multimorphosa]